MPNENQKSDNGMRNLQDIFLNEMRKSGATVQIYLTNGYQVRGRVKGFDSFTVVVEGHGKEPNSPVREQLVYKHAISTIMPLKETAHPIIKVGNNEEATATK